MMMPDRLRYVLATLSVFLLSLGFMGLTPKKSEAGAGAAVGVCVAVVVGGTVAYCIYDDIAKSNCKVAPGCVALATGPCVVAGGACGGPPAPWQGACACGTTWFWSTCYCG